MLYMVCVCVWLVEYMCDVIYGVCVVGRVHV